MTVLDRRALNRATLARQLLLDRAGLPVADAMTHLCGLQAQEPQEPYVGLWSRLRAFDPAVLSDLLVRRRLVRTHLMRPSTSSRKRSNGCALTAYAPIDAKKRMPA
nr:winged helix DNA-binding domain-containing protein [Micromonospora provocatoris]